MTDRDALLLAIIADPADDTPRLAFADACDEAGDHDRAEFVRVQVELARMYASFPKPAGARHIGDVLPRDRATRRLWDRLARRESRLMSENVSCDARTIKPRFFEWCEQSGLRPEWVPVRGHALPINCLPEQSSFRRGFVAEFTATTADFLAHAAELFAAQPVEAVRLADKEPRTYDPPADQPRYWWWSRRGAHAATGSEWELPDELYYALDDYVEEQPLRPVGAVVDVNRCYLSPELARAALSAACVAHGRHLAGLPPFTPARVRP